MCIEPPNLIPERTRAFFTTRAFAEDSSTMKDVLEERLNISKDNIYLPVQKHTNRVHIVECGSEPAVADAVVTGEKNTLIGVVVADCVPILFYDSNKEVVAAVHAGWRGTAQGIVKNTIETMEQQYGCNPEDMLIALGPSIRMCSYEVGKEVIEEVQRATGDGKYCRQAGKEHYIDLSSANRIQALKAGASVGNIWQSDECTFCNPDRYYSYRYSNGSTGRQGGFIGMW